MPVPNVRAADRKPWIELARCWHALRVAVLLNGSGKNLGRYAAAGWIAC